jgi:hypothetical protein
MTAPGSPVGRAVAPLRARPTPGPNESEFLAMVTELAVIYGWRWAHFRVARTEHGWRTPVSGPLGKGWPDLVLTRERDGRMIYAELKTDTGRLTDDQSAVLGYLMGVARLHGWLQVHIWRPRDFDEIQAALR